MINVLVVEDEPPIQRMICKTISGMDQEFSVRYTAFNGIQARRILEAVFLGMHVLNCVL